MCEASVTIWRHVIFTSSPEQADHLYECKFLVLSTMGTKGKQTVSASVDAWYFWTVKSIYLTHFTWKILCVFLWSIYSGTNPLVFATSRKAHLLTENMFSQFFLLYLVGFHLCPRLKDGLFISYVYKSSGQGQYICSWSLSPTN